MVQPLSLYRINAVYRVWAITREMNVESGASPEDQKRGYATETLSRAYLINQRLRGVYQDVTPSADTKTCTKCSRTLPLAEFHNNKTCRDGKRHQCKHCVGAANREWQARNPEHAKACWKRSAKKQYTGEKRLLRKLKEYGITPEQFENMQAFGGHKCHICGNPFDLYPYIDHCHESGAVRGILCFRCNTAIGSLRDNPTLIRRAADYVEQIGFFNGAQATVDGQLPLKETSEAATASGTTTLR